MILPTEMPAASLRCLPNDDPPVTTLVPVGDTYASMPSSSAVSRLRSAWNGSVTSRTVCSPRAVEHVGDAFERLVRRPAGVLEDERILRHAVVDEVAGGRLGLGEPVGGLLAARHDDDRRQTPRPQRDHMVEPRRQLRRRPAVVLGGAEHHDRVDRPGLVTTPRRPHLVQRDHVVRKPDGREDDDDADRDAEWSAPPAPIQTHRLRASGPTSGAYVTGTSAVGTSVVGTSRVGHDASWRSSAARSLRSVSSRPITSSDSNSGGPTVRPVTATRTGAWALPSFCSWRSAIASSATLQLGGDELDRRVGVDDFPQQRCRELRRHRLVPRTLVDLGLGQEQEVDHRRDVRHGDDAGLHVLGHPGEHRSVPFRWQPPSHSAMNSSSGSIRMYSPLNAASFLRSKNAGAWLTSSSRNSASMRAHGMISVSPAGAQPSVIR